ncbi:MAG: helix-turn-helix domain-containing protein [Acidobacteriaceae bacterium]
MSLPVITRFPPRDEMRIRALLKSWASGLLVPMEFAQRVYEMGQQACHRAIESIAAAEPEEQSLNLSTVEKATVAKALALCKGDKFRAAKVLGIGKTTLYRKVAIYKIEPQPTMICPACGHELRRPRLPKRIHNPATAVSEATAEPTASAPPL